VSWDNFCSCSRTIGYKNRADADACWSNRCIRGFASARRSVGKDRRHPERPGRDNAVAFSYSSLAVDKSAEDGACHSKQSLLRRFDLDQCANCNHVWDYEPRPYARDAVLLRGAAHEATAVHQAYRRSRSCMAARGARPGSTAKAASHRLSSGSDIAKREIRHVCAGSAGARLCRRP